MLSGRAALLSSLLCAAAFSRVSPSALAQPVGRDAAVGHDASGDVPGDALGDGSADAARDRDATQGAALEDLEDELDDDAARGDAGADVAADGCLPPRAVIDRAEHCCLPGQRATGARCEGSPTSCPPGETHDRAGACVARPPDDADAGTSARLGVARAGAAPAGMVAVPGAVFRAGGQAVSVGPFLLDAREVSAEAYRRCVAAGVCPAAPDPYGQMAAAPVAPVVNVTWSMAARYCGWAGGRLPTEHEWELAARGLDGRRHPWGERAPDCTLARHAGCGDGALRVGALPAGRSPFGLLDMAGNVAEWTADRFGPRGGREGRGALRDPVGAARGAQRVVRGGSFASMPADLSLDARRAVDEREARTDVGFRCARGL